MTQNIHTIIRKIFDDYDEKNGALQKIDYTDRASKILITWIQGMNAHGLTTELICELHRIVCDYADIAIHDEQGNILSYTKAGEYRTHPSSRKSELRIGARRLFLQPEVIASKMEQLVAIMSSVLAAKPSHDQMVENILSFTVEFSTIHPFANQNGRMMQLLMELLAYQAGLEPFHVSRVNKLNSYQLTRSIEQTILYQTVHPLRMLLNQFSKIPSVAHSAINKADFQKITTKDWSVEAIFSTLYASLLPKYQELLIDSEAEKSFFNFINHLASFVFDKYTSSTELSLDYFSKLHTFLYEKDFKIIIRRESKYYENLPGEWRKHPFLPRVQTTHFTLAPTVVEKDLQLLNNAYNAIKEKSIFDVLKYVFDFLRIHPFADSNLTVISLVVDIECLRLNFEPLSLLKIRFENKKYAYGDLLNFYEANSNNVLGLEKTYQLIVDFHKASTNNQSTQHDKIAEALNMAKQAFDTGDFPVGSIMTLNGEIISKAKNEIFTKNNYHHAEINLIENSLDHQNAENKVVYVTLEPCWRCAQALVDFGVKEVYYILEDPLYGGYEILKNNHVKITKLSEYKKAYAGMLFDYFTQNEHLQQMTQCKVLYEHVKKSADAEQIVKKILSPSSFAKSLMTTTKKRCTAEDRLYRASYEDSRDMDGWHE